MLSVVRSKVVTTWIVWKRPRKLFCISLRCRVDPNLQAVPPEIALF